MNDDPLRDLVGSGSIRIAVIGVLAILALFLVAQTVTTAENFGRPSNPATDTITVSADGQAALAPDVAHVSFTVDNTAAAVSDAQAATTKQANAAIAYVKGQGVADADVTTLSYNISPQYSNQYQPCAPEATLCPATRSVVTGYEVSETVQVTVHDLTSVGSLLAGLGKLQVQNVSGPDFALSDSSEGYDAARADAISKAKAQASLLASQLGVSLGKIVNFSESSSGYPYPMYDMAAGTASASAPTPQVPTGQNTYTASVSITYEIR